MKGGSGRDGGSRGRGRDPFEGDEGPFLVDEDVSVVPGDLPPPPPRLRFRREDRGGEPREGGGSGIFDEGYGGSEGGAAWFEDPSRLGRRRGSARERVLRAVEEPPPDGTRVVVGRGGAPVVSDDMSAAFEPDSGLVDELGPVDATEVPPSRLDPPEPGPWFEEAPADGDAGEPAEGPAFAGEPPGLGPADGDLDAAFPEGFDFNTLADEAEAAAEVGGEAGGREAGAVPVLAPRAPGGRLGGPTWIALGALVVALGAFAVMAWSQGGVGGPAPEPAPPAAEVSGTAPEAAVAPAPAEPVAVEAPAEAEPAGEAGHEAAVSPGTTVPDPVRSRREAAATGALLVDTDPGVKIYVDGELVGEAPRGAIRLPQGMHDLRLVPPRGRAVERRVRVDAGRASQVRQRFGR